MSGLLFGQGGGSCQSGLESTFFTIILKPFLCQTYFHLESMECYKANNPPPSYKKYKTVDFCAPLNIFSIEIFFVYIFP